MTIISLRRIANMTKNELAEKMVKLAARWRDEGEDGQTFVASTTFAIASVCAASGFPKEEVESLTAEAIERGYAKITTEQNKRN